MGDAEEVERIEARWSLIVCARESGESTNGERSSAVPIGVLAATCATAGRRCRESTSGALTAVRKSLRCMATTASAHN
eukprot:542292-Pleurochrysis_carterae.AAC.1